MVAELAFSWWEMYLFAPTEFTSQAKRFLLLLAQPKAQ